jgi:hypothetical protein
MKSLKQLAVATLLAGVLIVPFSARAVDEKKAEKAKPYPLKTCGVSDEDLGSMGDPYAFTHEGQEIKLCCKSCLKTFKKEPAKYLKKLVAAENKNKKS